MSSLEAINSKGPSVVRQDLFFQIPEDITRKVMVLLGWGDCSSMSQTGKYFHKLIWEVKTQDFLGKRVVAQLLLTFPNASYFPTHDKVYYVFCKMISKSCWFPEIDQNGSAIGENDQETQWNGEIISAFNSIDLNLISFIKAETKKAAENEDPHALYLASLISLWGVDEVNLWFEGLIPLAKSALKGYSKAYDMLDVYKEEVNNPQRKSIDAFITALKENKQTPHGAYLWHYFFGALGG